MLLDEPRSPQEEYGHALARLFDAMLAEGGEEFAHRVVARLRRSRHEVDVLELPTSGTGMAVASWVDQRGRPDGRGRTPLSLSEQVPYRVRGQSVGSSLVIVMVVRDAFGVMLTNSLFALASPYSVEATGLFEEACRHVQDGDLTGACTTLDRLDDRTLHAHYYAAGDEWEDATPSPRSRWRRASRGK